MKQPVCVVFDRKISLYEGPFTVRHTGEAQRDFAHLKQDPKTKFGRNPEDFELYHIAYYDDAKGQFQNLEEPIQLGGPDATVQTS